MCSKIAPRDESCMTIFLNDSIIKCTIGRVQPPPSNVDLNVTMRVFVVDGSPTSGDEIFR